MAPRAFVDSSLWIAFLSARDRLHDEADRAVRAAIAHRLELLTTNLVLAEVHRWLLFRAGVVAARAALDRILASTRVRLIFASERHHLAALEWLARMPDQRISYTDAVSFAVMQSAACTTAMTFDRDFVVAGFTPWQPPRSRRS